MPPIFSRHSFLANVLLLGGANALGPLIVLLVYPALTRIYAPADFGVLGTFEAILSVILVICTLRYHLAIPMPDDDREAASLLCVSMLSVVAFSTLAALAVLMYRDVIAQFFDRLPIARVLWLLPPAVFLGGTALAFTAWQIRQKNLARVASARVAQGVVQAGAQLSLGAMAAHSLGLPTGLVLGRLAAALALISRTTAIALFKLMSATPMAFSLATAWKYRRLPLLSSWSAVINTMGQQASVLIIAASFSAEVTGWYSLAFFIMVGPQHILSQAIEQSFLLRLRVAEHAGRLAELSFKVFKGTAVASIAPVIVFMTIAPSLFGLLFGSTWTAAGEFCAFLAPSVVAALAGAHLPSLVVLRRWQGVELLFNASLAAARCAVLWWWGSAGNASLAVLGYGVVSFTLCFTYSAGLLVAEGISLRRILWTVGRELLIGLVLVAPIWLVRDTADGSGFVIVSMISIVVALGYVFMVHRRRNAGEDSISSIA